MRQDGLQQSVTVTVIRLVADHLGVPAWRLTPEVRIVEDLGADSLDHLELIMTVEERFGVSISPATYEHIRTLADIIGCVEGVYELRAAANRDVR